MDSLEAEVIKHGERIDNLTTRMDKLEVMAENLNKLALAVQQIADNQSQMLNQQTMLKKDVESIKKQPVDDAKYYKREIVKAVIACVVSSILGALLALIIKGGV